jgi:hypothetical protein
LSNRSPQNWRDTAPEIAVKCSVACSVSISGSLTFGKAKKASSSASNKIKTVKTKLKAGKAAGQVGRSQNLRAQHRFGVTLAP